MKLCTRVAVVMLASLFAVAGLPARSGGTSSGHGGGHGGSGGHGGHGGFSSGHSSGSSSGKSVGHAIGHSFGKFFGLHGKAPGPAQGTAPPLASAAVLPAKVVQPLGPHLVYSPAWRRLHHQRNHHFPFGDRFLFPRRPGLGGCASFGFPPYPFFFDDEFNCFSGGFFFDPFLVGGFSGSFVGSPQNEARNNAASTDNAKSAPPVTLLQLTDGSMYGLVDYWVEDGELHYTTTYGGQNSVELNRIDLEKTVQLNADRGVQFVLRLKTPPR